MPFVYVNSIRLRYESWGDGPPVVLLHGLGSCADDWVFQLPDLGRHFRCLAVDLRGHGLSDKPDERYTMATLAADVAAFVTALGIGPVHVVGLSLGGMVAQQLAISHPAWVRSLVLINTLPGLWPPPRTMLRTLWGRLRALRVERARGMQDTAAIVAASLFPEPHQRLFRDMTTRRIAENDVTAYRRSTAAIARFWPGRTLQRVVSPTLILSGELDTVVPPVYQERLLRRLPHARLVRIPGSRHASNIDRPEVVNPLILEFLLALEQSQRTRVPAQLLSGQTALPAAVDGHVHA